MFDAKNNRAKSKAQDSTRLKPRNDQAVLLYSASEGDANMLYAVGFFVPDPFIFFQHKSTSFAVLSDLEIDRAKNTAHGRVREPEIARWVAATHGIRLLAPCSTPSIEKRHLATPDGIGVDRDGPRHARARSRRRTSRGAASPAPICGRCGGSSTSSAPSARSSRGRSTTRFVPVGDEPRCAWVDRDEAEIAKLVRLATALIDELHRRTTTGRAPSRSGCRSPSAARQPFRALALAD